MNFQRVRAISDKTARHILLTPELAQQMLDANKKNRTVKSQNLEMIERAIENGDWKFNGDTIRIDKNNNFLDGQHRCIAVVNTGIAIETLLITGLEPDVFDTIDTGSPRTKSDTLTTKGEKNTRSLAAALVLIHTIKTTGDTYRGAQKVSNAEVLRLLDLYPTARDTVAMATALRNLTTPAVAMAMCYLFSQVDHDMATDFFNSLLDGVGLDEKSPIYLLRQRLWNNATSKSKLRERYIIALFIKAWNYYRAGKQMTSLRFREEGPKVEEFPTIDE